jgi:hypothetical protein
MKLGQWPFAPTNGLFGYTDEQQRQPGLGPGAHSASPIPEGFPGQLSVA